eukprot:2053526-Rhodomonas_salina.1
MSRVRDLYVDELLNRTSQLDYPNGTTLAVSFTLSVLRNRPVTGRTGTFTIQTTSLKGLVSDESTDTELTLTLVTLAASSFTTVSAAATPATYITNNSEALV